MKPTKNTIVQPKVHIWLDGEGYVGEFNELELMDFQCQIAETKSIGYYATEEIDTRAFPINENGEFCDGYPEKMMATLPLFKRLFQIRKQNQNQ